VWNNGGTRARRQSEKDLEKIVSFDIKKVFICVQSMELALNRDNHYYLQQIINIIYQFHISPSS